LKSLEGISNLPQLEELYCAENELVSFSELGEMAKLKKLHLRAN
jgi:Leucine-rich repeat (LRR) protein